MNLMLRPESLPHFDEIRVGTRSFHATDHIKAFRLHQFAKSEELTPVQFARLCARYEGLVWDALVAPDPHRIHYAARFIVINRVANAFPHLSSTQLGRIFNRNHCTILFNLGRLTRADKWPLFFSRPAGAQQRRKDSR